MKSMETRIAEQNVDASIAQFETAVNHLISKVEGTAAKVNDVIDHAKVTYESAVETIETTKEKIMQPMNVARDISQDVMDRALILTRDLRERVSRNPEPYISWAALAFGLFLCYRAVKNHRRLDSQRSWSQLEP